MALGKTINSEIGVDVSYWRIDAVNINYTIQNAVIVLQGYLDKDARSAGKKPINSNVAYVSGDMFDQLLPGSKSDVRKPIYEYLKTLDLFLDATNV